MDNGSAGPVFFPGSTAAPDLIQGLLAFAGGHSISKMCMGGCTAFDPPACNWHREWALRSSRRDAGSGLAKTFGHPPISPLCADRSEYVRSHGRGGQSAAAAWLFAGGT